MKSITLTPALAIAILTFIATSSVAAPLPDIEDLELHVRDFDGEAEDIYARDFFDYNFLEERDFDGLERRAGEKTPPPGRPLAGSTTSSVGNSGVSGLVSPPAAPKGERLTSETITETKGANGAFTETENFSYGPDQNTNRYGSTGASATLNSGGHRTSSGSRTGTAHGSSSNSRSGGGSHRTSSGASSGSGRRTGSTGASGSKREWLEERDLFEELERRKPTPSGSPKGATSSKPATGQAPASGFDLSLSNVPKGEPLKSETITEMKGANGGITETETFNFGADPVANTNGNVKASGASQSTGSRGRTGGAHKSGTGSRTSTGTRGGVRASIPQQIKREWANYLMDEME
jgi:hypothetical protein